MLVVQAGMRETQDKVGEGKEGALQQQRSVVVLKGQLLHWRLLVANAGQQHSCPSLVVGQQPSLPAAGCVGLNQVPRLWQIIAFMHRVIRSISVRV